MIRVPRAFIALSLISLPILAGCGDRGPALDIWTAAGSGNTEVIRQHLSHGTDLDAREPAGGSSPLIVAALFGQTAAARLLVEHGAAVDPANGDGSTALHVAAFFGHPETVAFLLEQGADLEVENRYGHTPLETVSGEWTPELEDTYEMVAGAWGLELDLERIREARPRIADLIRRHGGGK